MFGILRLRAVLKDEINPKEAFQSQKDEVGVLSASIEEGEDK